MLVLNRSVSLLVYLGPAVLGLLTVSAAAGVRARSIAAGARTALLILAWLVVIAVLALVVPLKAWEVLVFVCALAAWTSRVPYLVAQASIGRVLMTVPDRTGPHITAPAGALTVALGLLLVSGKVAGSGSSLLIYVGIGIILLGIALGLNFLFPIQVGTAGILDPYGGLSSWDNIESYSWSADGDVLELQLRRSMLFRRRSLAIPPRFRKDVAAYLSHRLWGAEEQAAPQQLSAES